MKLQYKAAGLMIFIGVTILVILLVFYSRQNRQIVLQKELQNIKNVAVEKAHHMESHLKENAAIARTVSNAPIIRDALTKSNAEYEAFSETERIEEIDALNRHWKETKEISDSFIQKHLMNPVADFLKLQQNSMPGLYGELFLTNRYGVMIASTGKLTTLAHAHKYWWKASYDGEGRVFFDDRGFDASVEGYVIGVVVPVKNGNDIIGILKFNINLLGPLTDIMQELRSHNTGKIQIVRTNGLIVAEKGKIPLSNNLLEDIVRLIQTKKVGANFIEENGIRELVAFSPINLTMGSQKFGFGGSYESIDHIKGNTGEGWHIVITLNEDVAIIDANKTTLLLITVGIIFTVVTSFIALLLGKWTAKPLVKLTNIVQKIGEGHLNTRISDVTKDEIGALANAFNNMVDKLAQESEMRKQVEKELRKSEEKYRILTEIAPVIIYQTDKDGKCVYANPTWCKHTGLTLEETLGDGWLNGLHPDDKEMIFDNWNKMVKSDGEWGIEYRLLNKNGDTIWIYGIANELRNEDGDINGYVGVNSNITELKQAEDRLKESEELFRTAVASMNEGFVITDAKINPIFVNERLSEMTGYDTEELIGADFTKFFDEKNLRVVYKAYQNSNIGKGNQYELRGIKKDGTPIDFLVSNHPIMKDGVYFRDVSTFTDITEKKQVEEALKSSEKKYRKLFNSIVYGYAIHEIILDKETNEPVDYRFLEMNPAFNDHTNIEAVAGLKTKDIIGKTVLEVLPETEDYWIKEYGKVALTGNSIEFEAPSDALGKHYRVIAFQNQPGQFAVMFSDITEQKEAERQIKANLKEKETLLQEIHHRVKNNMAVISSLLSLQANSTGDERLKIALMDSKNRVQSMSAIHETLYQSESLSSIDLNGYISKLTKAVAQNYALARKVSLKIEAEHIFIGVKQASPLGLIVNELITNSFKHAFPENQEGEIKIRLLKTQQDQIELEYADDGIGITENFNLQKADSLGLKLIKMLAENQLDGSIDMESKNGTKFIIKFNIEA